ncbi:hypothetical protein BE20_04170 [Sorangium cellulosum]|uniref:Uncharacterized protein n=1 Tax=Sorangium cellulosum TaxID=56 RepID=A0A150SX93_SORCE|nr:hypothetical protein BE18_22455 [Sorangium cellulosum]KYF97061.1 hypothetical protein BE20_04170 [Sorangium cellulosum]
MSKSRAASWGVAVLFAGALGGAALGCGGYDEDEARAACDALVGQVATSDEAAHDDCMDCHMECGSDCVVQTSFPPQFVCED